MRPDIEPASNESHSGTPRPLTSSSACWIAGFCALLVADSVGPVRHLVVTRGGDVIAAFHHCARTREPIWMRQIMHLKERAPRYVEGVAVYLEPERIYGGLVIGELGLPGVEAGFERAVLTRAGG